jgi:hypothetical protein
VCRVCLTLRLKQVASHVTSLRTATSSLQLEHTELAGELHQVRRMCAHAEQWIQRRAPPAPI